MDILPQIIAHLESQTAIAAICGRRIFGGTVPKEGADAGMVAPPYMYFEETGGDRERVLDGEKTNCFTVNYGVYFVAESKAVAQDLFKAVFDAIDSENYVQWGTLWVDHAFLQLPRDAGFFRRDGSTNQLAQLVSPLEIMCKPA